jgi:hypothetical protein
MVEPKTAIQNAKDFILELYKDDRLENFLLEEVEMTDDGKYWLVTFGYDTGRATASDLGASLSAFSMRPRFVRDYKQIKVKAEDGQPISMKIYKL